MARLTTDCSLSFIGIRSSLNYSHVSELKFYGACMSTLQKPSQLQFYGSSIPLGAKQSNLQFWGASTIQVPDSFIFYQVN
jgi:hypothetical protein